MTREPEERRNRRRTEPRWLPSDTLLGTVLMICGLAIAVLILTGEIALGFAP
jgi:hypothetical protein